MVTMLTALLCPHATSFLRKRVDSRRRKYFGQKRLKTPEIAPKQPILLGIAEHSECVSASNGAIAYSCYKIGRACQPDLIARPWFTFSQSPEICVIRLGWRTWLLLLSNRHTGLSWGLHGDIYGRKEEGLNSLLMLSFLRWITITTLQQPRSFPLFS